MKETRKSTKVKSDSSQKAKDHGDEYAAIAIALHYFFGELHDDDGSTITIKHIPGTNSQWCSKILNMRNIR